MAIRNRYWPPPHRGCRQRPCYLRNLCAGYHGDTYGQTPVLEFHHYLCAVRKFGTLQELADLIETAAQQSIAYLPQRRKRNAP